MKLTSEAISEIERLFPALGSLSAPLHGAPFVQGALHTMPAGTTLFSPGAPCAGFPLAVEGIMKVNVEGLDRALRVAVGVGPLSLAVILEGNARWWGLVEFVPLLTGIFGFCPLYAPLGIRTCSPGFSG